MLTDNVGNGCRLKTFGKLKPAKQSNYKSIANIKRFFLIRVHAKNIDYFILLICAKTMHLLKLFQKILGIICYAQNFILRSVSIVQNFLCIKTPPIYFLNMFGLLP
jgi:hypothetical protein